MLIVRTGPGLRPTDAGAHAARRGTRAEGPGLRLGLPLVRHIVELHGGSIVVTSPGAGALFVVRLPLRVPAASIPQPWWARAGNLGGLGPFRPRALRRRHGSTACAWSS